MKMLQNHILPLRQLAAFLVVVGCCITSVWGQVQSPDQFLPHRLGETFTPHHLLVDYFEHVAANSPGVKLITYGHTNEQRPLLLAFVSTPENLARLEDIRLNNLRRAGLADGKVDPALDRAIVWLSYSVHGNEACGSEASMGVLYDLVNTTDTRVQAWLRNTIVVIDPALNPDGYSRYSHWYRGVANRWVDPTPMVREHREPWPGGRVNHYLFDLNRDWAWQTQIESRQRVAQYRQWLPHVHADLHEQYYNDPYYFAPAAQPYHAYLTPWQSDFQVEIGKNHARYFDQEGWLYFTREVFDLLYPSYGDTYPMFSGSIGMTYEQGGGPRGGRGITMANGDTLTLADRVAHHRAASLSTVEVASVNASRLLDNFGAYYDRATSNPVGPYKTYVIKGNNPHGRIRALLALLDRNGIRYGHPATRASMQAFDYQTGKTTTLQVEPSDLVVSAYQPNSVLTQVLFDPRTEVVDSLTYDITAWSLPYAYGLTAYASTTSLKTEPGYGFTNTTQLNAATNPTPYAYMFAWESFEDARLLADLLRAGATVRRAGQAFSLEGKNMPAGSLVLSRADNRKWPQFDATVRELATRHGVAVHAVSSGMSTLGPDLGSESLQLVQAPKVAVVAGEQTYANEFGQVWHFFEQCLEYPVQVYADEDLGRMDFSDIDVLILPEGNYRMSETDAAKLAEWVGGGGKLIAIGDALQALAGKNAFGLAEKSEDTATAEETAPSDPLPYGGQGRRQISDYNPGAIFDVTMDATHPLASGLGSRYFSLKTSSMAFAPLEDGWNVGRLTDDLRISGFVGSLAQQRLRKTLVFGQEDLGNGSVIYLVDNPLFRGFWENGKLLFSNALFF